VKYQPDIALTLTVKGTVAGGQFDWGGRLLKGIGGVQR
jgi:hypothetical protein